MPCSQPACVAKVTEYNVAEAKAQVESGTALDLCRRLEKLLRVAFAAAAVSVAAIATAKAAASAAIAAAVTGVGFLAALGFGILAGAAAGIAVVAAAAAAKAATEAAKANTAFGQARVKCVAANDDAKAKWDAHMLVCERKCVDYKKYPCRC